MWDLPRPGLEPVSPALAGGFLTTTPPGKPNKVCLYSLLGPKLPISVDKNVSLSPGTGRVPFTWGIYLLFSGKKGVVGRSE